MGITSQTVVFNLLARKSFHGINCLGDFVASPASMRDGVTGFLYVLDKSNFWVELGSMSILSYHGIRAKPF